MKLSVISESRKMESGYRMAVQGMAVLCLSLGMVLMLNEAFSLNCPVRFLLLILFLTVLACVAVPGDWFVPTTMAGAGLITAATAMVYGGRLANGIHVINNCVADAVGRNTGWILPKYVISSGQTAGTDMIITAGLFCIFLSLLNYVLVRRTHLVCLFCLLVLLAAVAAVSGWNIGYSGPGLLALGLLGVAAYRIYCPGGSPICEHGFRMAGIAYLSFALLTACGCGVFCRIYPADDYRAGTVLTAAEKCAEDLLDKLRYKKSKFEVLPKGDFSKVSGRKESDETALSVTMSEPQSCYLRGFVGSVCTADGWKPLDTREYYDSHDLYYWLHQTGFYGNAQLTAAAEQLRDKAVQKDITMSVENERADSEYLYTPYELKPDSWDTDALRITADESLASSQFFGDRKYTCHVSGSLVTEFPSLAARTFLKEQEDGDTPYIENESYYNSFVYENYTELSRTQASLLEQELGSAGEQKEGHIDYYSAIQKVERYLDGRITYDEACRAVPENRSFLNYFLTESASGYDVHYATAATLMFRYYGIPARYVEGYLITPEDIRGIENGETFAVPMSNGHAWTEIYIDGLGWVPIEVTPKYRERMEQPDLTQGLEAGTTQAVKSPQKETVSALPEEKTLPQLLQETMFDLLKLIGILLLIFDLFAVLFMLAVFLRRLAAGVRRWTRSRSRDNRKAVLGVMSDTEELLLYCNPEIRQMKEEKIGEDIRRYGGEELADLYHNAKKIWEKAAYSQHEISMQERTEVGLACRRLRKCLMKQAGWYERWVIRYIKRLA